MSSFEELIQKQNELHTTLKTIVVNAKKLNKESRTTSNLIKNLLSLDRTFTEIKNTHEGITAKATDPQKKTHEYFTSQMFTQMQNKYGEGIEFFNKEMAIASAPASPSLTVPPIPPASSSSTAPTGGMSNETGKALVEAIKNLNTKPTTSAANASGISEETGKALIEALHSINAPKKSVKIKPLEIPMFSGEDIREYTSFKSLCKTAIDASDYVSEQKLGYLKTRLKGKALNVIKHLELKDANYLEAWRLLDIRYGNKTAQTDAELKALQELNPIRGTRHLGDFRKLIDTSREVIANLKLLGMDVQDNDIQLFKTIRDKLDYKSRIDYDEKTIDSDRSIEHLLTFLETRYKIHENLLSNNNGNNNNSNKTQKAFMTDRKSNRKGCLICQSKDHKTTRCETLTNSEEPRKLLIENSICLACGSHPYSKETECQIREKLDCDVCHKKHLTSLHRANNRSFVSISDNAEQNIILPSIKALFSGKAGMMEATGLTDSCSTASYISDELARKLKLPRQKYNDTVSGLSGVTVASIKSKVKVTLFSIHDSKVRLTINALVCDHVIKTRDNPTSERNPEFNKLSLADPDFDKVQKMQFLLGADSLNKIQIPSTIKIDSLMAQKSTFGYIVSGVVPRECKNKSFITLNEIDSNAKDCLNMSDLASNADKTAYQENILKEITTIDKHGDFHVPLFIKPDAPKLGQSFEKCASIFLSQEKSVSKNPQKKEMSDAFMEDYLQTGHMREAEPLKDVSSVSDSLGIYYAPYHSIFKMDKLTTKVRNVFNFSSKSSNKVSLNDILYIGPNLLVNLLAILLTFRIFPIAFTADISMMYRTINLLPKYWDLQRIVWRKNPLNSLKSYQLTTVTYGVACSPALALMVLEKIAKQASESIYDWMSKRFYMDDYIFGSFTSEIGQKIVTSVHQQLKKSKMQLRKFASNSPEILQNIPKEDRIDNFLTDEDKTITVLGYKWNLNNDTLQVSIPEIKDTSNHTKRTLLSAVASLYDPCGYLLPVVVMLRILLQKVWNQKYDWDDIVESSLVSEFRNIFQEFPLLKEIFIPRWIHSVAENGIELLGFADASKDAIGCVIYARVKTATGYKISLLCAKSHLTPLHVKFSKGFNTGNYTTPKLELSALNLLADLMAQIKKALSRDIKITDCHAFTDSEVVLNWLHHSINENIISNKVIKKYTKSITKVFAIENIYHVRTAFNPADSASRGLAPKDFIENSIWFQGPPLCQQSEFPKFEKAKSKEKITLVTQNNDTEFAQTLLSRFSIFSLAVLLVARILRVKYKVKEKFSKFTKIELDRAEKYLVRLQQNLSFPEEMRNLKNKLPLPIRSKIRTLQPFLDEDECLRVGGRAEHDPTLSYDEKHPYLLDSNSILAIPLIRRAHMTLGHGGNKLVRRELRNKYWILGSKEKIKAFINRCPTCIRSKKQFSDPPIGQLPADRLKPAPAFSVSGVDFCGPFSCKASHLRGQKSFPAYVAVFVCFFTRAVHLELCSSLTAECFMHCFQRFQNRRGTITRMYSDNGKNFLGTSNTLKKLIRSIPSQFRSQVNDVEWVFNVPLAPDMAGLWEAAVKSFKTSLKKIINPTVVLSYEELNTILTHCEAILNSRPLSDTYDDNGEAVPLTPFHFLTHRNFAPLPHDSKMLDDSITPTKRWKFVEALNQALWKRWFDEIFPTLQRVPKYAKRLANLKLNDLVILKESTPSTLWPIGRVMKLYPGIDGIVRVVDVKTKNGTYRRKINHVLPLTPEEEQIVTVDNSKSKKSVEKTKLDNQKPKNCNTQKDNPKPKPKKTKITPTAPIININQPRLTRGQAKQLGITPQALITLLLLSFGQITGAMDAQSMAMNISEVDHSILNMLPVPERLIAEKFDKVPSDIKMFGLFIYIATLFGLFLIITCIYCYLNRNPNIIMSLANCWISKINKRKERQERKYTVKQNLCQLLWQWLGLCKKRESKCIKTEKIDLEILEKPTMVDLDTSYVNIALEFMELEVPTVKP